MFYLVIVNKMNYVGLKQGSICLHWILTENNFTLKVQGKKVCKDLQSVFSPLKWITKEVGERGGINYSSNETSFIKTIFSRFKNTEILEKDILFGISWPL